MSGEFRVPKATDVSVDVSGVKELVGVGIRRAVGFIALGMHRADEPAPKSLMLDANFPIRWFPTPVNAEVGQAVVGEFNAWLTGAGLREAEQYFALYLNEIWNAVRLAEFHGRTIPAGFSRDKAFDKDGDLEAKFGRVADAIGLPRPKAERFRSFALLRNALLYNRGVVRAADANDGEKLVIHFLTPQATVKSANGESAIDLKSNAPAGGEVMRAAVSAEKTFKVGEQVALDGWDLSCILFTYHVALLQISERIAVFLKSKGVPVNVQS